MLTEPPASAANCVEIYHGRSCVLASGEQGSEVSIRRDNNPFLGKRPIKYLLVVRMLHGVLADVDSIMARVAQSRRTLRGQ